MRPDGTAGRPPGPARRLTRLLEAVLGIGADLDLRSTLRHLVDGAVDLTGAAHGVLTPAAPGPDSLTEVRASSAPASGPDTAPDGGPGTAPAAGPDAGPGPVAPRLRVPVLVGGEEFGELRLTGRPGSGPFGAEDEQLVRVLAAQAGIAIGNARLYETARQRERWIEGAAAVTTALLTGRPAGDALPTVAERARLLADAAAGVILEPTAEGGMAITAASAPGEPDGLVGATIEPGSPVLEQLLGGEPVFVEDSATDPRMTTEVRHRFGPSMMLPLEAGGRLIGTLALPRRRGDRPYTGVERLLAAQFASQAALALVLADAHRHRRRLAVYEDRDRIARDLHDLVVQRLFATGLMLESTRRRPGADDVRDILGQAVDELRSTVQDVRSAILTLQQPPAERSAGLRGRVLRETEAAAGRLGFRPSAHFTGAVDSRVPDGVADRLLAALRRALAGTARRPAASRVEVGVDATVTLPDGRPGVRLTVSDDSGPGTTVTWQSPV
ncbi:histidine kinase [Streptomyces sp. SW4]|nr:histidine kinase [Streptomyces sp. SW4]